MKGKIISLVMSILFISSNSMGFEKDEQVFEFTIDIKIGELPVGNLLPSDSLVLYLINPLFPAKPSKNTIQHIAVKKPDGSSYFKIKTKSEFGYFKIAVPNPNEELFFRQRVPKEIIPLLYYEKGDSIVISITNKKNQPNIQAFDPLYHYDYHFSGKGALKEKLLLGVDSIYNTVGIENKPTFDDDGNYYDNYRLCWQEISSYLNSQRGTLQSSMVDLLLIDSFYKLYKNQVIGNLSYFRRMINNDKLPQNEKFKQQFSASIKNTILSDIQEKKQLEQSYYYPWFLLETTRSKSYIRFETENPDWMFDEIVNDYSGLIREKLGTIFLYTNNTTRSYSSYLNRMLELSDSEICRSLLISLRNRINGTKAYNFSLKNKDGEMVSLSDFQGKIVVLDFWLTGCGGCQALYKNNLATVEDQLKSNEEIVFVTISSDNSVERWQEGLDSKNYTSESAINLHTGGSKHPMLSYYKIYAWPTLIVINKQGYIVSYNEAVLKADPQNLYERLIELIN